MRIAFPFERELGQLFDALLLDAYDFSGEDPNSDALVALNGGISYVYLRNLGSLRWEDPRLFQRDVLPLARSFWRAHINGDYTAELQGSLAGVLVRDVEGGGWESGYRALSPEGDLFTLEEWFASQPENLYVDPVHRLRNLAGPLSGDLLLISNYAEGYYFGAPVSVVHDGLHPEDSQALLVCGWPDASDEDWAFVRQAFQTAIAEHCQAEGGRWPSTADPLTGIMAVL